MELYWRASRDSRYSGVRRGIGDIRGIGRLLGSVGGLVGGVRGVEGVRGIMAGWQGL